VYGDPITASLGFLDSLHFEASTFYITVDTAPRSFAYLLVCFIRKVQVWSGWKGCLGQSIAATCHSAEAPVRARQIQRTGGHENRYPLPRLSYLVTCDYNVANGIYLLRAVTGLLRFTKYRAY
jgi:hypothetical protein